MRPHKRVSMLVRRHRSDRRHPDHRSRPTDDTLSGSHSTPPKSSRANSHVNKPGFGMMCLFVAIVYAIA
jgi:hypothetical protein